MTADFLDFDRLTASGRTPRTSRKPSLSETSRGLFTYRSELMASSSGGGASENHTDLRGTPAPRAPRTQRRTTSRKPASGDDAEGDGEPAPRFTISSCDGFTFGTATANTLVLLMVQYGGRAVVPIELVCADYFAPLTLPNLRRKIAAGDIGLPLVRMEADCKRAAQGVYLTDLAEYIDARRAAAVKERNQLCN